MAKGLSDTGETGAHNLFRGVQTELAAAAGFPLLLPPPSFVCSRKRSEVVHGVEAGIITLRLRRRGFRQRTKEEGNLERTFERGAG